MRESFNSSKLEAPSKELVSEVKSWQVFNLEDYQREVRSKIASALTARGLAPAVVEQKITEYLDSVVKEKIGNGLADPSDIAEEINRQVKLLEASLVKQAEVEKPERRNIFISKESIGPLTPNEVFEQYKSRFNILKVNQSENPLVAEVEDLLGKYDRLRTNIAWESDPGRQTAMKQQLEQLNFLPRIDALLNSVEQETGSGLGSLEKTPATAPVSIGDFTEIIPEVEKGLKVASDDWRQAVAGIPTETKDESAKISKSIEGGSEITSEVESALARHTGGRWSDAEAVDAKASSLKPDLATQKTNLESTGDKIEAGFERQSRLRANFKSASETYLRDLNTLQTAWKKNDKPFLANVASWLETSEQQYKDASKALALSGVDASQEFTAIESQIDQLHKKLKWGERNKVTVNSERTARNTAEPLVLTSEQRTIPERTKLVELPAIETSRDKLFAELTERLSFSQEKFSTPIRERAKRMSKVLALSLSGLLYSSQPAGERTVIVEGNNVGGFRSSEVAPEAPVMEPFEVQAVVDELQSSQIINEGVSAVTKDVTITPSTPSRIVPLPRMASIPSPVERPLSVDTNPPEQLPRVVEGMTLESVTEVLTQPTEAVPASEAVASSVEVRESGSALLIEVEQDSTVSQAMEKAYEAGLFAPYLTRSFATTTEFIQAYLAFDRAINSRPELVKNILEITSGDTNTIPAGASFNVRPILSVINGEQTVEGILQGYTQRAQTAESALSEVESAVLNEANDTEKLSSEAMDSETNEAPILFVTPVATEAYKSTYEGGQEAWERDFETYIRTYLPIKGNEGWLGSWFSAGQESVGDIFEHISTNSLTVSEFNSLRDGDARTLRNYLRQNNIPIADFRDLQTMLYEIGMSGQVQILEDMTLLQVLEAAFVVRHSSLLVNQP